MREIFTEDGASETSLTKVDALFREDGEYARPFMGLETKHQQLKYYKTEFHLTVSTTHLYAMPIIY